jgi:hypothetical protein
LLLVGEFVEVVVGGFNFDYAAFWIVKDWRFSITTLAAGLRKKSAVGHASTLAAELGREKYLRLELLASGVEKPVERRIKRRLSGRGTCRADGAKIGEVVGDAIGRLHAPLMIAQTTIPSWVRILILREFGAGVPVLLPNSD